jgi:LCP family protein required for cell wall assembly
VTVALVLVCAGGLYGYARYRWGQVKTASCASCVKVASGQPFNVLIVGSDSRVGDTGAAAQAFGNSTKVSGQRSDTIKVLHVDPATGQATLLSIPRDTYVSITGLPASSGLAGDNKINSAFNNGPDALIDTIEDTFGIPIAHFVVVDFTGLINAVNSVGGISLDFTYPVRDNNDGTNQAGLNVTSTGCQVLSGSTALALARSRYYEYEVRPGDWEYDPTGDLGRIQRQNAIIEALIDKAKSTYNPVTLNSFLGSIVNDVTVDQNMSFGLMLSLAETYHAFSGSALQTFTLPTEGAYSDAAGDVEVVQEPQALQVISTFLGTQPESVITPPLDAYGNAVAVPTAVPPASAPSQSSSTPTTVAPGTGSFNPTPC